VPPTERDQFDLWGISRDDAEAAGMTVVESARAVDVCYPDEPAVVIPYFTADGTPMLSHGRPFSRIRRLAPPVAGTRRYAKYLQPPRTGAHAYFPKSRRVDWRAVADDTSTGVIITEGEAKALSACLRGFETIGLGGVWSFSAPNGRLIPDLSSLKWAGRQVFICFDSDASSNPAIVAAEARLVYDLQTQAGAICHIVRLPPAGTGKVGLDDFLRTEGGPAFQALLDASPAMRALDAKIVGLNRALAWIEFEGMVYDTDAAQFIKTSSLVRGSRWSTHRHVTMSSTGQPKEVGVADKWLTHPLAQRFSKCLFRPGAGLLVDDEAEGLAMNLWRDTPSAPGDVQPFLDLTAHVFSNLAAEHRDLPLKLMAYKARNPAIKIPLALVLIGPQGSGKSLWAECLSAAFAPYTAQVTPKLLASEFQNWIERSLLAVIDEADGDDITRAGEQLKALVSNLRRPMNEKYRPVRDVNTYTQYVICSNRRAVGSFAADDRRMIVVDVPPKREPEFYQRVADWKDHCGPALLHWLRTLPLDGWTPPQSAPMTPEKYLAYTESLTAVQHLAEQMRTATSSKIVTWLDAAAAWAQVAELSPDRRSQEAGRAVATNISGMQVRPWYTPAELALLFPSVALQAVGSRFSQSTPAGQISRDLREAGISYLVCSDDPRGFTWRGQVHQFLVIADFDRWRTPVSQADFDEAMRSWPTYGRLKSAEFRK
jgi:putative DNA primase/helicase